MPNARCSWLLRYEIGLINAQTLAEHYVPFMYDLINVSDKTLNY